MQAKVFPVVTSLLVLLVAGPGFAGSDPGDRVAEKLAEARIRVRNEDPEGACKLLREALALLASRPDGAERETLTGQVEALLKDTDPISRKRSRIESGLSRAYSRLAGKYEKKGWTRMAADLRRQAAAALPGFPAPPGDTPGKAGPGGRESLPLAKLIPPELAPKTWKMGEDWVQAPPGLRDSKMLLSREEYCRPFRAALEMKVLPVEKNQRNRWCALVIGHRENEHYYTVDLVHRETSVGVRILRRKQTEGTIITQVVAPADQVTREGAVPLVIEVGKGRISFAIAGTEPVTATIGEELPAGRLGFLAFGPGDGSCRIAFRNIRIELLPPPAEKKAPVQASASGLLEEAAAQVAAGKEEAAAFTLAAAERLIGQKESRAERSGLYRRFNALLAEADDLGRQRCRLRSRLAKGLVGLGRDYRRRQWGPTAARCFARAEEIEPGSVPTEYGGGGQGGAETKATGVEDVFAQKQKTQPGSGYWCLEEGTLRCEKVQSGGSNRLLSKRKATENYMVDLEFGLGPAESTSGLVFGAKPSGDHFVMTYFQTAQGFGLGLNRFEGGRRTDRLGWGYPWSFARRGEPRKACLIKKGNSLFARFSVPREGQIYILFKLDPEAAAGALGFMVESRSPVSLTAEFRKFALRPLDPRSLVTTFRGN